MTTATFESKRRIAALDNARKAVAARHEAIQRIGRDVLQLPTLESRARFTAGPYGLSDALDFHTLSVWQLREALHAAYRAGINYVKALPLFPGRADEVIQRIGRGRVLQLPTLLSRKSDALDFHDLSVWQLREALHAAYRAGIKCVKVRKEEVQS